MLTLIRPLIWLDVETHAKASPENAHIIELGFEILYPDARPSKVWEAFIKPPVPIEEDATEVHKITNEMVADAKPFVYYAKNLAGGFSNCDFGGYHVHFDLRVLAAEMQRANVEWTYKNAHVFDPLRLWQLQHPRSLTHAVREFCGREPNNAHRALADAQDARDVGMAMLARYPDLPKTLAELHQLCFPPDPNKIDPDGKLVWNKKGEACLGFGSKMWTPLSKADPNYLEWMVRANFSAEVKDVIRAALKGVYPKKETANETSASNPS